MKTLPISIIFLMLLSSCSTRYKPNGFTGGYDEVQLAENIFSVTFRGNGYTRKKRAVDFCLLRCAEVTKDNGFRYFSILDQSNDITNSSYTAPSSSVTTGSVNSFGQVNAYTTNYGGQTYNFSKPSTSNTILLYKNKPQSGISYEADFIIKSIGTKYGVYAEQKIHLNHESNKVTHKNLNPSSKKNTTSKESSYSDKKKQLLDEYLGKKITKEEYFKLRRELDKSYRN